MFVQKGDFFTLDFAAPAAASTSLETSVQGDRSLVYQPIRLDIRTLTMVYLVL